MRLSAALAVQIVSRPPDFFGPAAPYLHSADKEAVTGNADLVGMYRSRRSVLNSAVDRKGARRRVLRVEAEERAAGSRHPSATR